MTPKEVLIAARARISDPAGWTTGWYARSASGERAFIALGDEAVQFCAMGAVAVAAGAENSAPPREAATTAAVQMLAEAAGVPSNALARWNDEGPHAKVLAAFDRAIELAP